MQEESIAIPGPTFERLKATIKEYITLDEDVVKRAQEKMKNAMYAKLFGKAPSLEIMRENFTIMWGGLGELAVTDLLNGYFLIVDHNTHLQDGKLSNPIDVKNFNSGERGRHEDPIAVYGTERIVREKANGRNQPIAVEDDDADDDLLGIAIIVSLSDMDDQIGKRSVQAIDSYVDVFDCEYVGESSYSRKRDG
ncbi:hypothetical protein J5N97_021853 [Dioscorea zingiberensis]|uniref:Uncharacterized protein n=1 Tax=Dioscorea zingiberensis TaxID=325984 RepID=A0A9D5C9A1_9LILI|nr:hypothetical protein J5N97_021853 [Dioscorea zingiberensis]